MFGCQRHRRAVGNIDRDIVGARTVARHEQGRALLDQHLRRDPVDLAQLRLAHADELRRLGRLERLRRLPDRPGGERALVARQAAQEEIGVVVGQQHPRRAGGEDHRLVHLRIELLEFLHRDHRQPRRHRDIDVALDRHADEVRVVLQPRQREAETLRLHHDVAHRLQLGQVVARLVGHPQARVVGRQAGFEVAVDRPLHIPRAPVVGRQRELPVAEAAVERRQVVERGAGRGQHVAPVVAEDVLPQLEILAGGRHELPHAGGGRDRHRLRIEGALDEGQQREIGRQAAAVDLFHHMEQVAAAAPGHALHIVGARGVPLLPLAHQLVVDLGQRQAGADAGPEVGAGVAVAQVDAGIGAQRVGHDRGAAVAALGGRRQGRRRGRRCRRHTERGIQEHPRGLGRRVASDRRLHCVA